LQPADMLPVVMHQQLVRRKHCLEDLLMTHSADDLPFVFSLDVLS
jgi:hypothetical protein